MEKPSCELLSGSFPNVSENLRWIILVNLVFNNFLTYTAIMLNVVTIHAIRKTSSLPNTLKTLLLNLTVTDVDVGLIVQPIYCSLLVKWLQKNINCNFRDAFVLISSTFCLASFLGVVVVSVDSRILGNSSSSQISGTCDSQACCCCGDLHMAS